MKFLLFFIIINIFLLDKSFSADHFFESNFIKLNLINNSISEAKNKEINKIKLISFNEYLKKILTKDNLKKFYKLYDINNIDHLIKNILIEDEFISIKRYKANIKINFEKKLIINLLRNLKINYTDYFSPKILLIANEINNLTLSGLSNENSFYDNKKIYNYGFLNFTYPDLTPNDRFILPYDKIENNNLKEFNLIAEKYKVKHVLILNINKQDNLINIHIYSYNKNFFLNIGTLEINFINFYHEKIFNFINNWWKDYYIIDNSIKNKKNCSIKNFNIHELYFILSKINSLSQIETINLSKIFLNFNSYDFVFYGDFVNLTSKLNKHKIQVINDYNNKCIISAIN